MRIIAGKWRSVPLLAPPDPDTRPILDQVKEALFNMLGARLAAPGELPPCRVLDLFAGTGSLGLEALSRGASFCTFVEGQASNARILRQNIEKVRAEAVAEVLHANIWKLDFRRELPRGGYELVFVDPPFRDAQQFRPTDRVTLLLTRLAEGAVVVPGGTIVLRHPVGARCDASTFAPYGIFEQRTYGKMMLSFLRPAITESAATGTQVDVVDS